MLLKRWNEGFALLAVDSFGLLAFPSDGADSVCAEAVTTDSASAAVTAPSVRIDRMARVLQFMFRNFMSFPPFRRSWIGDA